MYPTTVAKIESGERQTVRIDEAAAFAELFELPVDALLNGGHGGDLGYVLRMLVDTAVQGSDQLSSVRSTLSSRTEDVVALEFDGRDALTDNAQLALQCLDDAVIALRLLARSHVPAEVSLRPTPDDTWRSVSEVGEELAETQLAAVRERHPATTEETQ